MKKSVLILLGLFMMVSTVEAKNGENFPDRFGVNYSYNNAVNFIERGIEFHIFTNGDFDFDTQFNNRRLHISRNYKGQIRRIGNVFINYDYRGNVTRIGNIFIRYYRGRLINVGDLRVRYDNWNYPIFYGNVRNFYYDNGIRFNIGFGDVCDYNDAYFAHRDFRRNYSQIREDRNYYYYRANPNARIGKRSTILKRRKPTSLKDNSSRRITKRNSDNSYRNPKRRSNNTAEISRNTRNSNSSYRNNADNSTKVKTDRRRNSSTSDDKRATRNPKKSYRNSSENSTRVKTNRRTSEVKREPRNSKKSYRTSERKSSDKNSRIAKKTIPERKRRGAN